MALTDRLAALVDAIAAAFNARVQAPASGYDVAVLNGYTGTQAQWLASLIPQPTPQLPVPSTVERFDALADGAAWPTRWTLRTGGTAAGATPAVIGGRGRMTSPATIGKGLRQQLEAMPAAGEVGIMASAIHDSVNVWSTLFIGAAGTATGNQSGALPDIGYGLVVNPTNQQVSLVLCTGETVSASLASVAVTITAGVEYLMRLERIGGILRGKVWRASLPEPEAWTIAAPVTTTLSGFAGVGQYGNNASQTSTFDNVLVYGLEEVQATNTVPGILALANQAETNAATEFRKALTPGTLPQGVRTFAPTYARSPVNFTGAAQWLRIGRTTAASDANGSEFDAIISNLGSFGQTAHGIVHLAVGLYGKTAFAGYANVEFPNDLGWDIGYVKSDYAIDIWIKQSPYNDQVGVTLLDNQFASLTMDQVQASAPSGYVSFERRAPGKSYGGALDLRGHNPRSSDNVYRNEVWYDQTHAFIDLAITTTSQINRDTQFFTVPATCKPYRTAMIALAINQSDGSWIPAYAWIGDDLGGRLLTSNPIPSGKDALMSGTYRRQQG